MKNFLVDKSDHGKRLDVFLRENSSGLSGKKLKSALQLFTCKINGKFERFASYRVKVGDRITFNEELMLKDKAKFHERDILFEDENLFIINKAPHIVCEEQEIQKFTGRELYLAHRLDKQTTGVLILAKNLEILKSLEALFKNRKVEKRYLAIVLGKVDKTEFNVSSSLKKVMSFDGGGLWKSHPKGLGSKTVFKLLDSTSNESLLHCSPITGRTHQIRAHLAESGHPILGDYLYGGIQSYKPMKRFMLHSEKVAFIHPVTKRELCVTIEPPLDFVLALQDCNLKYE